MSILDKTRPKLECPTKFNPKYIQRAWALIARDGAPREVRILKTEKDGTVSGIFTDPEQVAAAIASWDGVKSIYLTVNPLKPEMLARENVGKLTRWTKDTTADADIASRAWLIIDVDPVPPVKHVSATEAEQALAIEVRDRLAEWLTKQYGFPAPIRGRSGNGGRLLYAIELPNNAASTDLIRRCLRALDLHWTTKGSVEIDTSVFNASRVDKVWGTMAVKGGSTDERPYRRAYLDVVPAEILPVPRQQLEQLAALAPEKVTVTRAPSSDAGHDFPALLEAIQAKGLYLKQVGDGHFITCPWKDQHTENGSESETELFDPAAKNGYAGGFRCQHKHCTERRIADVYALFIEPAPSASSATVDEAWPAPLQIPDDMPAPPELTREMLPPPMRDWIFDIAHRMQCPPDYPAAAALVALGTIVGKKVQLLPKQHDNWAVVPNLWGFVVGAPGILKSPATKQALLPIFRIAQEERDKAAKEAGRIEAQAGEIERLKAQIKREKKGDHLTMLKEELAVMEQNARDEKPPVVRRLITNDATIEKLGMLLNENPNGLLIEREELTGLFHAMEQEGHQQDRSFYLESWDGRNSKAIDRVMRGSLWVPSCVLSILGTIQPGPLAQYLLSYHTEGQADGFIERFQVSVYPAPHPWGYVDEAPNLAAIDRAVTVYTRLHAMNDLEPLHFSADAQTLFIDWWGWLERSLARNPKVHPLLQSHFSKYRSLMPSLALLFQLATSRTISEVGLPATQMAAAWCDYLAGHARRIYWPAVRPGGSAMALLAEHLPTLAGQGLTARDIEKKHWSGLQTSAVIETGLKALAQLHWVRPEPAGRWRTETRWAINPSLPSLPLLPSGDMNSLFAYLPTSLSSDSRVPVGGGSDGSDAAAEEASS